MFCARLFSSTTTPGQTALSNVSLSSTSPGCCARYSSVSKTFGIERDRFAGFAPPQLPAAHVDDESGDFQAGRGRFHVHEHNKSVFFIEPPKIFVPSGGEIPFATISQRVKGETHETGILFHLVVLLVATAVSAGDSDQGQHTRTCGGEACDAVFRGFFTFFDRSLHGLDGNGRSCADCHMPSDQFQLSPASAEARFQQLQMRRRWNPKADDPLFRPIDADDFRLNGASRHAIFAICARTAWCVSSSRCRRTCD